MQIKKCQKRMGGKGLWLCHSLQLSNRKISDIKVIEYYESRPHKAVTFMERGEEQHEWNEQKLPSQSGGEGYQEEAWKRKEGKKEKKTKEANRGMEVKNERIEEVIKSSQRMALEEYCISESQRIEGKNNTKMGLFVD